MAALRFLIALLVFTVYLPFTGKTQGVSFYQYDQQYCFERPALQTGLFTACKPWSTKAPFFDHADTLLIPGSKKPPAGKISWIRRKLFHEHLIKNDSGSFRIYADPLMNFSAGLPDSRGKKMLYTNTRGFHIGASVAGRVFIHTCYYETQERPADYVSDFISRHEVAPGAGRVKDYGNGGYDYGTATGTVSWLPSDNFGIRFGHDRNFIGDGYRSLLLSDNSFPYPFLSVRFTYGRLFYQSLFASLQNPGADSLYASPHVWYHGFQSKAYTMNYLGFNISRWLQAGLFESVMWKSAPAASLRAEYFIPVIFINTFRYSLFSEENAIAGLTLRLTPVKNLCLYGQLAIDDLHPAAKNGSGYQKNKTAWQGGIKYYDAAGVRNLFVQAEYNQASPYTYGHSNPLQSYTHYNQPLAHPLGANFREGILFIRYRWHRVFAEFRTAYAVAGKDTSDSHWGNNVFLSDTRAERGFLSYGNGQGQGVSTTLLSPGLRVQYIFNILSGLSAEAGYTARIMNDYRGTSREGFFYIGIRTSLFNQYRDF